MTDRTAARAERRVGVPPAAAEVCDFAVEALQPDIDRIGFDIQTLAQIARPGE